MPRPDRLVSSTSTHATLRTAGLLTSLALAVSWALPTRAAETPVTPGTGTLAAAIAAASPGDTLILQNGTYTGNAVVNKALTIRAINMTATTMVSGTLTIDAPGAAVTVQGLDLGSALIVTAGADVKILENDLYGADINVTSYKTSEGDGTLLIIGNRLHTSGEIAEVRSNNAYVAGNTLDNGYISAYVPVWIVGNAVSRSFSAGQSATYLLIYVETLGDAQIIGNRVTYSVANSYTSYVSSVHGISTSGPPRPLLAGNIVAIYGSGNSITEHGIVAGNSVSARVVNNTIACRSSVQASGSYGIVATGQIAGNIVVMLSTANPTAPISGSVAQYNLCANQTQSVGSCGSSALKVDPKFVDTTDYRLAADSPAINAGPPDPALSDLDRTRNDMGAYGGPWPIDQFDAQRDPAYLGPFIYPLFDANASLEDSNTLQVRALSVARLR